MTMTHFGGRAGEKHSAMTLSKVMLSITLLLWRHIYANVCDGFFEIPNSMLQGHVIDTITTTEEVCRMTCKSKSTCYSINYIRQKSRCELSGATHFAFPAHFTPGAAPGAYYAIVKPLTNCSNSLCSSGMACMMGEGGKAYRCVPETLPCINYPKAGGDRGHNFLAISCAIGDVISMARFDTYNDVDAGTKITDYINGLPGDVLVALTVVDEGSRYLSNEAKNAISTLGANNASLAFRETYAFVGYKGEPKPAWHSAMTLSKVMLSITLLLWRHIYANVCDGFFEIPNSMLQGHVIDTITTTEEVCRMTCKSNSTCYSINYIRQKSRCELSGATHFAFPAHFTPGAYYAIVKPLTNCSNNLCSSGMACMMREGGKAYRCGKI
ncbi:predicted protein [Nematostella vectensis]|uniref:Apple domain-containing protein n=1 Tax=Nematostella vectensis TaxID=45351 RepID=A7SE24_NEMVE|nr:predicted protein [Nematostella vectensis]|eukprot:XP_001630096.1 predicted protein [Nematostella vectensis]